jgi:hypothetical protein
VLQNHCDDAAPNRHPTHNTPRPPVEFYHRLNPHPSLPRRAFPGLKSAQNFKVLIANETHSREKSYRCKQSTYHFLIANEIHSFAFAFFVISEPLNAHEEVCSTGLIGGPSHCIFLRRGVQYPYAPRPARVFRGAL